MFSFALSTLRSLIDIPSFYLAESQEMFSFALSTLRSLIDIPSFYLAENQEMFSFALSRASRAHPGGRIADKNTPDLYDTCYQK